MNPRDFGLCSLFAVVCVACNLAVPGGGAGDITLTVLQASDDEFNSPQPVPMTWEVRGDHHVLVSPKLSVETRVRLCLSSPEGGFYVYLPYLGTSDRFRRPGAEPLLLYPHAGEAAKPVGPAWEGPRWRSVDAPGRNVVFLVLSPDPVGDKRNDGGVLQAFGIAGYKEFAPADDRVSLDAVDLAVLAQAHMSKFCKGSEAARDLAPVGSESSIGRARITVVAGRLRNTIIVPVILDFMP